jgi:hypothetical protein
VVCFNRSLGLFQPYNATVKRFKRWSSTILFCSDHNSCISSEISHSEANIFSLFVLNLGLDPVDQQKSRNDCLILLYKCSNLYTVHYVWLVLYNKIYPTVRICLSNVQFPFLKIDEPPDLFSKSGAPRGILDMHSKMRHRRRGYPIRSFGSRQSRRSTMSPILPFTRCLFFCSIRPCFPCTLSGQSADSTL